MLTIYLQSSSGGGGLLSYIFPLAMVAVMYVFFLRPQNQRRKEQENFQTDLKPGMEIVTTSGIIGKISKLTEDSVTVIVSNNNTTINFMRSSISKELTDLRAKPKT